MVKSPTTNSKAATNRGSRAKVPRNAYQIFLIDNYESIEKQNGELPKIEVISRGYEIWKSMSEADKDHYHERAILDKRQYEIEHNLIKRPESTDSVGDSN